MQKSYVWIYTTHWRASRQWHPSGSRLGNKNVSNSKALQIGCLSSASPPLKRWATQSSRRWATQYCELQEAMRNWRLWAYLYCDCCYVGDGVVALVFATYEVGARVGLCYCGDEVEEFGCIRDGLAVLEPLVLRNTRGVC